MPFYTKQDFFLDNLFEFDSHQWLTPPIMARIENTPEDLESVALELQTAVDQLKSMATAMRECNMPHVLIHGSTHRNLHIPAVIEWVDKTALEVKSQIKAFTSGVLSRPEIRKRYNENQKLAAAKKPFTPKQMAKKKSE
jgi:hypothetical protein